MPHALNRCCNLFQGKEKQQSMPFISDLILCWRRRRSGDCHSGASQWICQSRSCSLSQLWPSRRSLRLPLQHQFQTTTHLRRETLKKTFSALRKPSLIYENLVRLNSQSHGVGRLQGTGSQLQSELQEESPDPPSDRNLLLSQPWLTLVDAARVFSASTNLYNEVIYY